MGLLGFGGFLGANESILGPLAGDAGSEDVGGGPEAVAFGFGPDAVLAAVLPNLNVGARIPLCGLISRYNGEDQTPLNLGPLLANRVTLQGFIISDHPEAFPPFIAEVAPLVQSGQLRYREDIVDGLENAPTAFLRLFRGENFGKLVVRVG